MEIDNDNAETVVNDDRLSTLPAELIHQVLACFDTKFAVQTCVLSPRWRFLWTTMPYLNFGSAQFSSLPKFAKFVNHVLTRRNHQIEVISLSLRFTGAASQVFVRKIANYAFAHNIQELTVKSCPKNNHDFPPCLFSSPTLKNLSFSCMYLTPCLTPKTPWDFPALTTLHLSQIALCDDKTREPVDIFSKCVNLKNLTLNWFSALTQEAFDIIAPQLSTLVLIKGRCSKVMNLNTPQLKNLTIVNCSIRHLNAPPGLSYFCYKGNYSAILFKNHLHSLDKANVYLGLHSSDWPYKEEDACKIINMLQKLHSARFLTLNIDILECISKFPELVSQHPSPFSNLVCLNINSSERKDTYNFQLTTQVRDFLLENSPTATFIMELPEKPPSKGMIRKAKLVAEVERHMIELQSLLKQGKTTLIDENHENEKTKIALDKLLEEIPVWVKSIESKELLLRIVAPMKVFVERMRNIIKAYNAVKEAILSIKIQIRVLLKKLPKKVTTDIEERYSHEFKEGVEQCALILLHIDSYQKTINASENVVAGIMSTLQEDVSANVPGPSTSSIDPLP